MTAQSDQVLAGQGSCRFGASRLLPLLDAFEKEINGVKDAKDIEYIHRMRVASRRVRAALPLFSSCFPPKQYRSWMNEMKKITRALGEARDTDVQIEFLRSSAKRLKKESAGKEIPKDTSTLLQEINSFIIELTEKRGVLQNHVISALNTLEKSGAVGEMRNAFARVNLTSRTTTAAIPAVAADRISARLAAFLDYEHFLSDPDAIFEHHAMRIAAKKLRYTMEVYGPVYRLELKKSLRRVKKVQEILGDVHDCDVWIDTLTEMILKQRSSTYLKNAQKPGSHTLSGLRLFLHDREKKRQLLYKRMVYYWNALKRENTWGELRQSLVIRRKMQFVIPRDSGKNRERAVVDSIVKENLTDVSHAAKVTSLSLSLFDQTMVLHKLGARERSLLEYAALLHDIGWKPGQKGHAARGREMVLLDERLPFDLVERSIIGIVVRAYGKSSSIVRDPLYTLLSEHDRGSSRILSALIIVAEGLDSLHTTVVEDVRCVIEPHALILTVLSGSDSSIEKARARTKSELLAETFSRTVVIV
jgi:CHAD domain-containing protein